MPNVTPDQARKLFHELQDRRDAILAVSGPLREARDAFVQKARAEENAMNAAIKEAETGLYDIDVESASWARFLNGKTGERPSKGG